MEIQYGIKDGLVIDFASRTRSDENKTMCRSLHC